METAKKKSKPRRGWRLRAIVIILAFLGVVVLVWGGLMVRGAKVGRADRCRMYLRSMGFALYRMPNEEGTLGKVPRPREDVIMFLARERLILRTDLVCPSEADPKDASSYETWTWDELKNLRDTSAVYPLVWEKRPNHSGKQWVFWSNLPVFLMRPSDVERAKELTKVILRGRPGEEAYEAAKDALWELWTEMFPPESVISGNVRTVTIFFVTVSAGEFRRRSRILLTRIRHIGIIMRVCSREQ